MNALAASDVVLAVAVMLAIAMTIRAQPLRPGLVLAIIGWLALACAAVLGALRYGGLAEIEPLHRSASDLAATVGLPAVACGLCLALMRPARATQLAVAAPLAALVPLSAYAHDPLPFRTVGALLTLSAALVLLALMLNRRLQAATAMAALALLLLLVAAAAAREQQADGLVLLHYALAGAQLAWLMLWRCAVEHRRTQSAERHIKRNGGVRINGQMPT